MLFKSVVASTAGTYLKMKDIICSFVQTSCGVYRRDGSKMPAFYWQ